MSGGKFPQEPVIITGYTAEKSKMRTSCGGSGNAWTSVWATTQSNGVNDVFALVRLVILNSQLLWNLLQNAFCCMPKQLTC